MQPNVDRQWPVALSNALYRCLLVLYPSAFRSIYGAEMAQVFRDRARDVYRTHGTVGILTLWPAALHDVIRAAVGEHLEQERQMSRKTLPFVGGLVVLLGVFLAVAAPQALYRVISAIGVVFHIVAYQPVFNLLLVAYGFVHSFPLALVLVTLLFQMCLLPLLREQLRRARVLQMLQPHLLRLREQYHDQPQALRAAQRELYRQHGITPGALPTWLLLQLPFLYVLYYSFYTVILASIANHGAGDLSLINKDIYPFLPKLDQLPDLSFFWTNLGHPDPLHILPILAAVLTVLAILLPRLTPLRYSLPHRATPRKLRSTLASGLIQVLAAVLTLFFGWAFPAGLALSWGVSLLCAIAGHVVLSGRGPWS
ncbi:MAG TPA: membrane protein insertase YidC [Ktedonobacterales bacterium]